MKQLIAILTLLSFVSCKQKFEKDIWVKNANMDSDNPRFDMVEDLELHYLVKGTNSKQVFELLDKPDEGIDTTQFGIHWTYSIGSNPGFHIDPYYLVVDFDSTGQFIETRVIEH